MLVISTFLLNAAFNFALGLLVAWALGPSGYGQFALAAAFSTVTAVLFLDWLRLAAIRFYGANSEEEASAVRGTLEALFWLSALGLLVFAALLGWLTGSYGLPLLLAALVPVMAITQGLHDYRAAMLRSRFLDRDYARLVVLRSALCLLLMVGGALATLSPVAVAAGQVAAVLLAVAGVRRALRDPASRPWPPDRTIVRRAFLYAAPLVAATLIYYTLPLVTRWTLARDIDFAAAGHFSLAFDLTFKLIQTVGSALDIFLFQLALKAHREGGEAAGRAQLQRNLGIVIATVTAVALGFGLVLPSFEALVVPLAYRGPFAEAALLLLPGTVAFSIVQFGVAPVLQLTRRTWPMALAALAGLVALGILLALGLGQGLREATLAQSLAYGIALLVGLTMLAWYQPLAPRLRDVVVGVLALALMLAAVWPLREMAPGLLPLALSVLAGAGTFAAVAWLADLGGVRGLFALPRRGRAEAVDRPA